MGSFPFVMPPPHANDGAPVWNGREFVVGGVESRILCYETGASGWNDELTRLHEEETAGGSHFIDRASRARAIAALHQFVLQNDAPVILEVGVSGGHFLRDLGTSFPGATIIGADYTQGTLKEIAPRFEGLPLVQMDLTKSPFPAGEFDAIVLLNVLEHIERDDLAVAHCFRMLKPGGILVIEVPAGPGLYDAYDRELMHFRRYTRRHLVQLVSQAGFAVEQASHIGFFLYGPFWLSKKKNQARNAGPAAEGDRVRQAIQNTSRFGTVGHAIMQAEGWLARHMELPIGIRCTAVCRKPLGATSRVAG